MLWSCRRKWLIVLPAVGFLLLAAQAMAQKSGYSVFTDPGRRFSVEYPKDWTWLMISGSGEPLATFSQPKKEAAFVVERFRLRQPLPGDLVTEVFAQIEADVLKENQPRATDVVAKMVDEGGKRVIVIDYSRPVAGADLQERVRQFSYPVGQDLYRVTCMAINAQFAKYEATFAMVAASLKPAGELPPPTATAPAR
jgi:hypothetical protein